MFISASKHNAQSCIRTEAFVRRCPVRKGVLRNFTIFTGKHQCQSLFFNKVAGLRLLIGIEMHDVIEALDVYMQYFLRLTRTF